jgi:hypothetical protein
LPLRPPQFPHDLCWDRAWAATMGAMALPISNDS